MHFRDNGEDELFGGLQLRMTLWVVGTVTIVATLILFCAELILRGWLERDISNRLQESVDLTTKLVEQRLIRIECATNTIAAVAVDYTNDTDDNRIDSMLLRMVRGMECIDLSSIVTEDEQSGKRTVYYAFRDGRSGKKLEEDLPYQNSSLDADPNWQASFIRGQSFWSGLYSPESDPHSQYMCFSVPVMDKSGHRRGMLCSQILSKWVNDIVSRYKASSDLDVTVYSPQGTCIVEPKDYTDPTDLKHLIRKERTMERTGWRMVFTADRRIISRQANQMLLWLAGIMLLLLVTIGGTIALTVRYVARPFVLRQRRMAESKAAMQRELDIAADTQRSLVPHSSPAFPDRQDIDLHACLHPALSVGGDLYDYFTTSSALYFCIGDVSGKGVPASLFMAATHYLFRSMAASMPMTEAMSSINRSLCTDNRKCMFVTFWFGRLDLNTGDLEYVNAGHNQPLLLQGGQVRFMPPAENMPLGVWEEEEYTSSRLTLGSGDALLLYTDGVTEAMSPDGQLFGDEAALQAFSQAPAESAEAIVRHILDSVSRHAAGAEQSDDITMLCLRPS